MNPGSCNSLRRCEVGSGCQVQKINFVVHAGYRATFSNPVSGQVSVGPMSGCRKDAPLCNPCLYRRAGKLCRCRRGRRLSAVVSITLSRLVSTAPFSLIGTGPIATFGADHHLALAHADGNGVEFSVGVGTARYISEHIVLAAIGKSVVAHLDILGEALYHHLECLLKSRRTASRCCKARWIF